VLNSEHENGRHFQLDNTTILNHVYEPVLILVINVVGDVTSDREITQE